MKTTFYKMDLSVAAFIAIFMALPATHAQPPVDNFATDPFGRAIRDPFDECIHSVGGTEQHPDCIEPLVIAPPPAPPPVFDTITLEADTNFDFDRAALRPEGRQTLDRLVEDIRRANDILSIEVVGHTDSIGTEAYNQGLSERRAAAVRDYLVELGINPNMITTRGMGETQPIAPNTIDGRDNPQGRAQNRRVEVTVETQRRTMPQT